MAEFLVPYANTQDGELIGPDQATTGVPYYCPDCSGALSVRGGDTKKKRRHFFHIGKPPQCDFTGETALHTAAKHAVYFACWSWLHHQAEAPVIVIPSCRTHGVAAKKQDLPPGISAVHLEYRVATQEGDIVADVALVDQQGLPKLIVEIKKAHAVDEHKAMRIRGIPWVELKAEEALILNPRGWYPLQSGGGLITHCELCADEKARRRAQIEREQEEQRQREIKMDRDIPYALREDRDVIVLRHRAEVDQTYRCPECRKPVVGGKNPQGQPYFYHPTLHDCSFMTYGDTAERHTLFLRLRLWLVGKDKAPDISIGCHRCVMRNAVDVSQARAVKMNVPITTLDGKPGLGPVVLLDGEDKPVVVFAVRQDKGSVPAGIPWMHSHVDVSYHSLQKPLHLIGFSYKNFPEFSCFCTHPNPRAKKIKVYSQRRYPAIYGCPRWTPDHETGPLSLDACTRCGYHFGVGDRPISSYVETYPEHVLCGYPNTTANEAIHELRTNPPKPRTTLGLPQSKSRPQ